MTVQPTDLHDARSFERAFRDHHGRALAAARQVLRDPVAAEDVVQDAFMHLWRNPDSFDARRGSLAGYVTMLARSRALDRWRSRSAREAAINRLAHDAELAPQTAPSAAGPALRRDDARRVVTALRDVPPAQRDAVLAFGSGATAREIAERAELSVATVKSRIRLGLEKARVAMEELEAAA